MWYIPRYILRYIPWHIHSACMIYTMVYTGWYIPWYIVISIWYIPSQWGIYHMIYSTVYTIWYISWYIPWHIPWYISRYIPCGIYHGISLGIYLFCMVYTMVYIMVYTIWYIPYGTYHWTYGIYQLKVVYTMTQPSRCGQGVYLRHTSPGDISASPAAAHSMTKDNHFQYPAPSAPAPAVWHGPGRRWAGRIVQLRVRTLFP